MVSLGIQYTNGDLIPAKLLRRDGGVHLQFAWWPSRKKIGDRGWGWWREWNGSGKILGGVELLESGGRLGSFLKCGVSFVFLLGGRFWLQLVLVDFNIRFFSGGPLIC